MDPPLNLDEAPLLWDIGLVLEAPPRNPLFEYYW